MKTQNPFTGRSSGSIANVTASTYLGQNILKSKPLEVRNPQSPKQLNIRAVFSQATSAAKSLSAVSSIAKRSARTGRTTNKTARTALNSAILGSRAGVSPNVTLFSSPIRLMGNGIGATTFNPSSISAATRTVSVSWGGVPPLGGSASDIVSVVAYNASSGLSAEVSTSVVRGDSSVEAVFPAGFFANSNKVILFICFDSADGLLYDSVSSIYQTVTP